MNLSDSAKIILCYGDSNTYGQRSDDVFKGRWPVGVRWPGRLQEMLGEGYYVIEEGFSGRTTDLNGVEGGGSDRLYLAPCLQSHDPDVVILMLGTNDCKAVFHRDPRDIASAVNDLIDDITLHSKATIILVSPIVINDQANQFDALYGNDYDLESVQKAAALVELFRGVAERRGLAFLDGATVASPGEDGVHFSKESHEAFAKSLAPLVTSSVR